MAAIDAFRFASLGSGSAGNATLVTYGDKGLLIDCGFSAKETVARLERLHFDVTNIEALLVTHEHGDHAKGVSVLSRKFNIPAYMSRGTSLAAKLDTLALLNIVAADQPFDIGPFAVEPITVPHDAREPLQFVVAIEEGKRLGVLTDLGSVTQRVIEHFSGCDALLVEANHDLDMLSRGSYPYRLQQRVSGAWGHLNNLQTARLLSDLDLSRIQHLVVGHISQKNNDVNLVKESLSSSVACISNVIYACQDEGFGWLEVN